MALKNQYLIDLLETVKKRNAGEPEFIQAVTEVLIENITKAIEILNKLKSKVTLVKADEKEYRLPFLMNIEQQAIETVLSELEKKEAIINEMAKDIKSADEFLDSMGYMGEYAKFTIEEIIEEYERIEKF